MSSKNSQNAKTKKNIRARTERRTRTELSTAKALDATFEGMLRLMLTQHFESRQISDKPDALTCYPAAHRAMFVAIPDMGTARPQFVLERYIHSAGEDFPMIAAYHRTIGFVAVVDAEMYAQLETMTPEKADEVIWNYRNLMEAERVANQKTPGAI